MDRTNVIGEKVKSLRTAKEISLEELADRTGLAVEQITRIEENIDIPSLAPLVKLARALGVRLGTFLDDQPDEAGPVVCRRGDADDTISFSNNALDARQHLHYHSLSRSKTDRHMEPFIVDIDANGNNEFHLSAHEGEEFIVDIDANGNNEFHLSAHEGEEFIMVLKGTLEINYGKYTYLLEEGDTIYYDSIVPHHVHAFEGQEARILAVIYTPI